MSEPAIGIGRITIPYTVSSLEHVCRMYVSDPHLSGSDYVIAKRPSIGGTGLWTAAATVLAATISHLLPTGTTVGTAILEEYSATGWIPRDTTTVTLPNLAGNAALAGQFSLTLRATNFTRPKIVLMEINQVLPLHLESPTEGGSPMDAFINEFTVSASVGDNPHWYMVNQHDFFLLDESFVAGSGTFNKKLRRARGL